MHPIIQAEVDEFRKIDDYDLNMEFQGETTVRNLFESFLSAALLRAVEKTEEKSIRLFINEYKNRYDEQTLSYRAGEICEDGIITNQQQGAEDTFAIGMPVYDKEGNELGKLSIGLFKNLNYSQRESGLTIPVYAWRVDGYTGKRQTIKTYYQVIAPSPSQN